ncbi:hypothetical protein PFISCL1PPCAC_18900, partial [Pristionchus fissidentatus]
VSRLVVSSDKCSSTRESLALSSSVVSHPPLKIFTTKETATLLDIPNLRSVVYSSAVSRACGLPLNGIGKPEPQFSDKWDMEQCHITTGSFMAFRLSTTTVVLLRVRTETEKSVRREKSS